MLTIHKSMLIKIILSDSTMSNNKTSSFCLTGTLQFWIYSGWAKLH